MTSVFAGVLFLSPGQLLHCLFVCHARTEKVKDDSGSGFKGWARKAVHHGQHSTPCISSDHCEFIVNCL